MKDTTNWIDKDKEKQMLELIGQKKEKKQPTIDERNKILDKTRKVLETGKGERLTEDEEEMLKDIAGVVYVAYKRYIELVGKKVEREDDEHEL